MTKKQHSGQVALVLVLVMTVVSALAVSLASRSTVDTKIQQTESENVQALLSAQTGIEQLVVNPELTTATGTNYSAAVSSSQGNSFNIGRVEVGRTIELNLTGASSDLTGLFVYWSPDKDNPAGQPATYIMVVYTNGSVDEYAYDYTVANNFTVVQDGSDEGYTNRTAPITFSTSKTVAKVRVTVLRSPALMEIFPDPKDVAFPDQMKTIKSVGSIASGDNSVKYGLQYDESINDMVPSVFDYALFSGGSISQ